jgi:hypothetical protein
MTVPCILGKEKSDLSYSRPRQEKLQIDQVSEWSPLENQSVYTN